jgi:hypothetical protein
MLEDDHCCQRKTLVIYGGRGLRELAEPLVIAVCRPVSY